MIIGRDYLLKKPGGPSAPKLFLDTRLVPLAVNGAGRLEEALQRAAGRTGLRPSVILGVILAGAAALLATVRRRRMAR